MTQANERMIRADGVEIATEAFGDPGHPAVLLIMGAMASMLWWPEEFCERLAGKGRYVIRYDSRDTGLSTTYEPGKPPYGLDDMADDAVAVLNGYGIGAGHIVGMSMGGMIGQLVALRYPARVASLTAISTSPVGAPHVLQTSEADTPPSAETAEVDWSDRAQAIEALVKDSRRIAGTVHPFDEARARELIARDFDRARNFASAANHFILKGGDTCQERLAEIEAPLLVIHGTADPVFPIEHGVALSKTVRGAKLVRLEGGGHELHEQDWNLIIKAIVDHTRHR